MENPRILFISRAYPPVTGGIENQNYELSVWLPKLTETKTIANTRGRKFLPLFAPYALIKALILLPKYDVVLLGDGTLSILGWFIKLFSNKPVISVVHGLDINWDSASLGVWYEKVLVSLYKQLWVKTFFKKINKFIAVGNETVAVAIDKGIPVEKVVFIPNGVDTEKMIGDYSKNDLAEIVGAELANQKTILTSGRLAKRKGVAWFIRNVLSKLPENIVYVVAGDGPDRKNIESAIAEQKLEKRVKLLGFVTDEQRNILFNTCDLFVQPNIRVEGDMEGFGISVIEAISCKITLVASNLEGLKDAIKDNQNGFLVEPENAESYYLKITELLANDAFRQEFGAKARQFVLENFSWEKISRQYLDEIKKLTAK